MDDPDRLKIAVMQMLAHNEAHIQRYDTWVDMAASNGLVDSADLLREAKHCAELEANTLRRVLEHIAFISKNDP